jgi:hypothetical protein
MSLVIAAVALHRFTEFLRRLGSIPTVTGGVAVLPVPAGAVAHKATSPTLYVTR